MTNELKIFENPEFGTIRTLTIDNKTLFCANDVAKALGYARPADAVSTHCKGSVKHRVLTNGGAQLVTFIPESDLYRLTFKSKLPAAEKFTDWVTEKVLPSIHKNGGYIVGQEEMTPTEIMASAVLLAQKTIADREARIAVLTAQNAELTPKAEFADAITASKATILIGNLATVLKQNGCDIGQNRLFRYLRENGYLIAQKGDRYNTPTQRAMDIGLFEVDTSLFTTAYGNAKISYTTRVTPKGQQYFIDKFVKERGANLMIPEAV